MAELGVEAQWEIIFLPQAQKKWKITISHSNQTLKCVRNQEEAESMQTRAGKEA